MRRDDNDNDFDAQHFGGDPRGSPPERDPDAKSRLKRPADSTVHDLDKRA